MRRFPIALLRHLVRFVAYGLPAIVLAALAAAIFVLENRPDLEVWHRAKLDAEFDRESEVEDFAGYLALEDRLFEQLQEKVRDRLPEVARRRLNRFYPSSLSDPKRVSPDWNRTYEWTTSDPVAAVLLIHGLSDSPYSLRSIAQRLHAGGAHVLGLRVPGHGTAPSALVETDWEDMAAAVGLAVEHLRRVAPGAPLVLVGYSNGGALAVQHTLSALEAGANVSEGSGELSGELSGKPSGESATAVPDALVLISPAIGITPLAALAKWQERLGHVIGLEKMQWNSIMLEYDPYKYGSFPLHAGQDSYELTLEIRSQVARLDTDGGIEGFPATIAFQSLVDATVSTSAIIDDLFAHLAPGDHELVIFDVRRGKEVETLMKPLDRVWLDAALADPTRAFDLTVVTNVDHPETRLVEAQSHPRSGADGETTPIGAAWPKDLYSLAHVALPFPPDDPVYGGPLAPETDRIRLGQAAPRGERGVLQVSGTDLLRLRWNPFHAWMLDRIAERLPQRADGP